MGHDLWAMRERLNISPQLYARVTAVALAALALIVLTGAAVRLTGSGLGCPDWPKCYGGTVPPLDTHAVIEYTNRLLTGFVGLAVIAASVLAWFRRPFRWHLALFGAMLPLGVIGQAILGALVVKYDLAPGLVACHFILSMLLLDAAFALAWCSRYEPGERRASSDRLGVWAVRCLIPLGQLTILAGTLSTGSGPHAGAHEGQLVHRFDFEGTGTLEWVVQRHSVIADGLRPGGDSRLVPPAPPGRRQARLWAPRRWFWASSPSRGPSAASSGIWNCPRSWSGCTSPSRPSTWLAMLWTVASAGRLEPRPSAARSEGDVRAEDPVKEPALG